MHFSECVSDIKYLCAEKKTGKLQSGNCNKDKEAI